jgi:hypothetical protein
MQAETTLSFLPGSRRLNWDSSQPFQVSRQIWRENIRLTPKLPLEGIWTKNDPTNGQLSKKKSADEWTTIKKPESKTTTTATTTSEDLAIFEDSHPTVTSAVSQSRAKYTPMQLDALGSRLARATNIVTTSSPNR